LLFVDNEGKALVARAALITRERIGSSVPDPPCE
jgi:hypothetical protein